MNLLYKTRGDSSPKGKPKVYFSCHPEDFPIYFEEIANDLLEKSNCSVWYIPTDCSENNLSELFADLEQMQLFVVLITSNYLFHDNRARDDEFSFAIANNIPILPIMLESGLEESFNQKCGNLQFLTKKNMDNTSLTYDEKLEKYLSSVLIGDELVQKIRAAFDAYIFLSYRKIDRKYAQTLMRLIHKNEFCRDIAIWYDEFLTPGENFNDSIRDALHNSDLFFMTITPNIMEGANYIITTEYPMAKNAGKPILPVEMVSTDINTLKEKFDGISNIITPQDNDKFALALHDALKQIAIKKHTDSPEHNFFIGLAYLNGIDMEVDYERALHLITSAADAGLIEAIDKLIHMYQYGIGVEINLSMVLKLLEKKDMILEQLYENNSNMENAKTLLEHYESSYALLEWFRAKRLKIGLADKRSRFCEKLDELYALKDYYLRALLDKGYSNIMYLSSIVDITNDEDWPDSYCNSALDAYTKVIDFCNQYRADELNSYKTLALWGLGKTYKQFAVHQQNLEYITIAEQYCHEVINFSDEIRKSSSDDRYICNKLRAYLTLQDIAKTEQNLKAEIFERDLRKNKYYFDMPEWMRKYNPDYTKENEVYSSALHYIQTLTYTNLHTKKILYDFYCSYAKFCSNTKDYEKCIQYNLVALDTIKTIYAETSDLHCQIHISKVCYNLALAYDELEKISDMKDYLYEGFDIAREIYLKYGSQFANYAIVYSQFCRYIANYNKYIGNTEEEQKFLKYYNDYQADTAALLKKQLDNLKEQYGHHET